MNKCALKILDREEGWRSTPYYCSEDYPTVGFGFKIGDQYSPLPKFKLPKPAGEVWLSYLVDEIEQEIQPYIGDVEVNEPRKAIIISMCYQLGVSGCLGFTNMWKAIRIGDWDEAASQSLDSLWARQTTERAERHAEVLKTGTLIGVYI